MKTENDASEIYTSQVMKERSVIRRASRMYWSHWLVLIGFLIMTLVAWDYTRTQVNSKVESRFERNANQVQQLLEERVQRYEDGLRAGLAALNSHDGEISRAQWRLFAETLNLEEQYPGINGIGVIRAVTASELSEFERSQRADFEGFSVYPEHEGDLKLPIQYIEPVQPNLKAVGLDVAHEENRLQAAIRARDSGTPQITGPIVLVQDDRNTPGFLFYIPIYDGWQLSTVEQRRSAFRGFVYAPFIANKLMRGTLDRRSRSVNIRIQDGESLLFDDNQDLQHVPAVDAHQEPQFTAKVTRDFYGRPWTFTITSTPAFKRDVYSILPILVLLGGLTLGAMLLVLFVALTSANRRALDFAERMSSDGIKKNRELAVAVDKLEASNIELEHFAYIASHDLQEPLRTLRSYVALLERQLGASNDERTAKAMSFIASSAARMSALVSGLLNYSQLGKATEFTSVDLNEVLDSVKMDLSHALTESDAELNIPQLPTVEGAESELRQLFQNLISNSIKFRTPAARPIITLSCEQKGSMWIFCVEDNGIGIEPEHAHKIFQIFQRLHTQQEYSGSGIGLANCKKIVEMHRGRIWVKSDGATGTAIYFTLVA